MLESGVLLLMNCLLLMLRISPGGSFPRPLSAEEERDCLERLAAGDLEARNTLVEHNLRLVAHIMKKYYAQTDDAEDLLSIGTIGLIKGINTYKPDKGVRLATYASRCVENEILMHFRASRKSANDVSLSEALDGDDGDSSLSILDVLAREDDLDEQLGLQEQAARLRQLLPRVLTEREQRVIRLRYGLDGVDVHTQKETAALCGISRSYVSRIEKKALSKLKDAF